MSLNPKQTAFVREYLKDGNGKQAAIRAGYSAKTAEQMASRLLRIVKVSEVVDAGREKLAERAEVTAAAVLRDLATIAQNVSGEATRDRLRALELIGRHLGMFKDRIEHSGPNGSPLHEPMKDIDVARRIAVILMRGQQAAEREGLLPPGTVQADGYWPYRNRQQNERRQ